MLIVHHRKHKIQTKDIVVSREIREKDINKFLQFNGKTETTAIRYPRVRGMYRLFPGMNFTSPQRSKEEIHFEEESDICISILRYNNSMMIYFPRRHLTSLETVYGKYLIKYSEKGEFSLHYDHEEKSWVAKLFNRRYRITIDYEHEKPLFDLIA